MLRISEKIVIPAEELQEDFFLASGPGGQNVNKVATAVRLRFNIFTSKSLPDGLRRRLLNSFRPRLTGAGELTVEAKRFRTQKQNRQDAAQRLENLIRSALAPPTPRRATRPTASSIKRRLNSKRKHSELKKHRSASEAAEY